MRLFYSLGIWVYKMILHLVAPFNPKARLWCAGRRGWCNKLAAEITPGRTCAWFHFASLGEFEQGRPVLEKYKATYPDEIIVMTFFSPSGYEIRKNYPLADHVFYLPVDTPGNARQFIELINPRIAFFTKYEYWYYYFRELHRRNIPLYLVSAIFRPDQLFFRWYGFFPRHTLRFVTHFFVQNTDSIHLLAKIGITHATLTGDTRFDRVLELSGKKREIPKISAFAQSGRVLVAGSTWPPDEENLFDLHEVFPEWKLIIAPHEIGETRLIRLKNLFPDAVLYSEINASELINPSYSVIIIDNVGMLSSLYAYADVAYIGGGFGAGIHNTLEAAAYGVPVIFGPRYEKFQEAKDLIHSKAGFTFNNQYELVSVFDDLQHEGFRRDAGNRAAGYVAQQAGATDTILAHIAAERKK